jgi:type II restriction/modification system DNA methylase subunit YeeA
MTITQIEKNLEDLLSNFKKESFIFDLLLAFGEPQATISRLQKGELNQLETKGELHHRKKILFKEAIENLHLVIDTLRKETDKQKQQPRFIVVTNYQTLLAYDTKTTDTLDIDIKDLIKHFDFFLPLASMEKSVYVDENPADVRASNKLAKLYDEILKENPTKTHEEVHALNVFLTRLLFCYFAEDSNIFSENIFTSSISSHTQSDGSDMASYLERLFEVFNTPYDKRDSSLPNYLKDFPYVNGGLFRDKHPVPRFTTKSRNILIEIGTLDWSQINPDIFGSMIQAVVTPEHRGDMGMHYTSVPNIMKVIQPLFLDELYEDFEKAKGNAKKLNLLHLRLQNLKIFDPACGSGNFLIISYKELRKLEMLIFKEGGLLICPSIKLTQFYGIELDDFAHEVAILSLWLAEHQMNVLFKKEFGTVPPALPLQDGGNIVHGNATRLDWEKVCPKNINDEIYILGNPPYLGSRNQEKQHKDDMEYVFQKDYKSLDYIACWFYLGAKYIRGINAKCSFVSTNSISQGEQVALTWPRVLKDDLEICFAHQSFKWQNNAKDNANVIVVIIGLSNISKAKKYLFNKNIKFEVDNINSYLTSSSQIYITRKSKPISKLIPIVFGNMPNDGGNLILSQIEKDKLINNYPFLNQFIKKFIGGREFLNGGDRWCLLIPDEYLKLVDNIDEIQNRYKNIIEVRSKSTEKSTRELANYPNRFYFFSHRNTPSIIVPATSSENRTYIPIGFLDENTIISNSAQAIYDAEPWIFGVISSLIHMVWMKTVGGKLKSDYRYSSALIYNTFPFPNISEKQKEEISELVYTILDEREKHSEKTLAQMYDPSKMPKGLKEAHHQLDLAIEKCYRFKPFENDEERLEYLFKMYEDMTIKEGK